jgi:hypothetical protein
MILIVRVYGNIGLKAKSEFEVRYRVAFVQISATR